ncbi:unnamed protein product [Rhizophagus irregularis]|nr:unnamed protein product [Rhizophagus irregularis]
MSETIKSKSSSRPSSRKVPIQTRALTKARKNNEETETQGDESQDDENMDNSPDTSKKHDHDLDIIDTTRKTKRASKDNNTDYYMVPTEFLEKLNSQNKVIWRNQIKQEKKLNEMNQMLRKMRREDALTPAFFEKGIVAITKEIQKTSLYPTQELFKERLEEYVEKRSNGYINDIGKHNWDSRFYSQFMPMFPYNICTIK